MQQKTVNKLITWVLTPLSWCYGCITSFRNMLFDKHLIHSEDFDIPVLGVGNLAVGGTGKTPHVEYIVSQLSSTYRIGIVSRGYRRSTKGFVLANKESTPGTIGDEPYQMYRKFGSNVRVAVCEKRADGIKKLIDAYPDINLIILDDSFQHRYVKPKVSVLLTDYNRPYFKDKLLPLGRLRESAIGVHRAEVVVMTKCPTDLNPLQYRLLMKELELRPYQRLFFSHYEYQELQPVFPEELPYQVDLSKLTKADSVILLSGVANPREFVRHFNKYPFKKKVCRFPDHRNFTRGDIDDIVEKFDKLKGEHKIIITTEKDAVRLAHNPYYPRKLKNITYFQPIYVGILPGIEGDDFIPTLVKAINEKEHPLAGKYL